MENMRNRVEVKLVTSPERFKKLVAKSSVDSWYIVNEGLTVVKLKQRTVRLERPIAIGLTILEQSKILMARFHHEVMRPLFPANLSLLFTDTDSLMYSVQDADVEGKLQTIRDSWLDTSNYPPSHPLYSTKNKKIPGYFKNEMPSKSILAFRGLKPKMYAFLAQDGHETKKSKGTKKSVVQSLNFEAYSRVLLDEEKRMVEQFTIRSRHHTVSTVRQWRIGLSPLDVKRWHLDATTSRALGHYCNI